jgi:hypothetical protein
VQDNLQDNYEEMSSRDWNTIGAGDRSPAWMRWAILPPIIPLTALAWIRFGHPAVTRTSRPFYGFLIFGAGLATLIVGMMLAIWHGSQRAALPPPMVKIPMAVAWLVSVIFTAVGLSQVLPIPPWSIPAVIPMVAIAVIIYIARTQSELDGAADSTPDECWSGSGVYYNPQDPAMLVRARIGYGYTLNMANPWAYRIIIGFVGGVAILVGFLILSLR